MTSQRKILHHSENNTQLCEPVFASPDGAPVKGAANIVLPAPTSSHSRLWLGVILILSFVILSDARDIVLEQYIKVENAYDYLLIVFGITMSFYAIVNNIKTHSLSRKKTHGFWKNILLLNFATASNWLGWYLSLKYLTAPTVVAIYAGMIPMITLLVNRLLRSASPKSLADIIAATLLLFSALAWMLFSDIFSSHRSQSAIGVGLVVMSSISIAITTVISKRLADMKVTTSQIMAHRFYVLLGIALFFASPFSELWAMAVRNFWVLFLAATVGTIASLWLLQKGIEHSEPVLTTVIIATSPAFSLILYLLLIDAASIETKTVTLSCAVVLIAIFHTLFQHFNHNRSKSIN